MYPNKTLGKVNSSGRNFLTNPPKKGLGSTTFGNLFSQAGYISDPYDRFEEMDRV
jgi:Domain of unknown function (DUF4586)